MDAEGRPDDDGGRGMSAQLWCAVGIVAAGLGAGLACCWLAIRDAARQSRELAASYERLADRERSLTREMLNRVQAPEAAVLESMEAEAPRPEKLYVSEEDEIRAGRIAMGEEIDWRLEQIARNVAEMGGQER